MHAFSIVEVSEKNHWDQNILSTPEANFLQSWKFGQFHKKLGKKIWYLEIRSDKDKYSGCALVVKEEAKRGNYLTMSGGPLVDWQQNEIEEILTSLFTYLKKLADQEACAFVRFRPQVKSSEKVLEICDHLSLQPSPMHLTADLTLQLDITQSEDELLKQMRKNTRYEIRKSKKTGVTTEISTNPEELTTFYEQQLALAEKHGFVPFSYEFLHTQFLALLEANAVALVHSHDSDRNLLASAFTIFYNKEAVYHYGVSTEKNHRLPGSYACQWAAILEAKKRGCTRYNFWGIAPKNEKDHRFAGVSLFKRGFGGEEVQYLPAHDFVVKPFSYALIKLFELLRKKLRHL